MVVVTNLEIFSQASNQVNFLQQSQINMVVITAFAITLVTFSKSFKYNYIKYLAVILFIFAISSGVKAVLDYNSYISDVRNDNDNLDDIERGLINRWATWSYFSYLMISIVGFILLNVLIIEFEYFNFTGNLWDKQTYTKRLN
jgi:ABC-type Fe3+-siderophore transport system permease subunit